MPDMDYRKLLGRIKEKGYTQKELAERIGLSESHLCQKLLGRYAFKQSEMRDICNVLDISGTEIGAYFFSPKS